MKAIRKLNIAFEILNNDLPRMIEGIFFEEMLARIRIILRDGTLVYIRYNNHSEYSYNVIFSNSKLDRIRFDNLDDGWAVGSKPHHFHPRNLIDGFHSPMIGDPNKDLPLFCKLLTEYKFRDPNLRL